ncbi:MAG: phage shock protein A [Arenicella sp.]|jgi:phage shock protein A
MWSKLNQRLTNLFKTEQKELSPEETIRQAISEIQQAIYSTERAYEAAKENEQRIGQQIFNWQEKSTDLYQKATEATGGGKNSIAKSFLASKSNADQQITQFSKLHQQALFAAKEMEKQLGKLQFRLEEMQSKKVLLSAQLHGAKRQKGLNELLEDLGSSGVLDDLETQLTQLEIENQLSEGMSEIDLVISQLDNSEEDGIDQIKLEIEKKKLAEQKAIEAKRFKKVNQLFSETDSKVQQAEREKLLRQKSEQQSLLENLLSEESASDKLPVIEDFFSQLPNQQTPTKEKEASLDESQLKVIEEMMAKEKQEAPKSENWADEMLQNFKKSEDEKDKKQKNIDDFFKS